MKASKLRIAPSWKSGLKKMCAECKIGEHYLGRSLYIKRRPGNLVD